MRENARTEPLAELADTDLPTAELERLARVDAILRAAAVLGERFACREISADECREQLAKLH